MSYPLMETPFVLVPFEEMNKKQVEEYFQLFMIEKDKRLYQLENYINKNNTEKVVLDKTPESLIPLWEWFEMLGIVHLSYYTNVVDMLPNTSKQ